MYFLRRNLCLVFTSFGACWILFAFVITTIYIDSIKSKYTLIRKIYVSPKAGTGSERILKTNEINNNGQLHNYDAITNRLMTPPKTAVPYNEKGTSRIDKLNKTISIFNPDIPETNNMDMISKIQIAHRVTFVDDTRNFQLFGTIHERPILLRDMAIFDIRHDVFDSPCVRVHILLPVYLDAKDLEMLECAFIQNGSNIKSLHKPIVDILSSSHLRIRGILYREYLMSFRFQEHHIKLLENADFVMISFDGRVAANELSIFKSRTNPKKPNFTFGVCVKTLYGTMDSSQAALFIEWVELNRLFGIDEIHIYNATLQLSKDIKAIFKYYEHIGILHVHQFHTPFHYNDGQTSEHAATALLMRAAINDCIYKYGPKFSDMLVIDPDEVLIPEYHTNYRDLLRHIVARFGSEFADLPGLSFASNAYFLNTVPDITQPKELSSMRFRYYVPAPDLNATFFNYDYAKSLINPARCVFAYNHFCLVGDRERVNINRDIATIHHYRRECKEKLVNGTCDHPNNVFLLSDRMLDFKAQLLERVNTVMETISMDTAP